MAPASSSTLTKSGSPVFSATPMPRPGNVFTPFSTFATLTSASPSFISSTSFVPSTSAPSTLALPHFTGSGTLLINHCATPQYTLINYGPTASYVPFIGCIDGQLECCPFTAVSTADDVRSIYPRPKDATDAILNQCPADYYSVSGSCCPNAYTPFTAALGGATPCYSTLQMDTTPQPVINDAAMTRATVTITDTVFALQYAVQDDGAPVSTGGIAGILIGCSLGAGALLVLFFWFRRCYRRRQRLVISKSVPEGLDEIPCGRPDVRASAPAVLPSRPPRPASKPEDQSTNGPDRTSRIPVWQLMTRRSRTSGFFSVTRPARFSVKPQPRSPSPQPDRTSISPLNRQSALINRPRAAYRLPSGDLKRWNRVT